MTTEKKTLTTEEQRAKWREAKYKQGVKPLVRNGARNIDVQVALARHNEFMVKYQDAPATLDKWQEIGVISGMTERVAVEAYYGLDGKMPRSLAQIGEELGVSRQRVDQWLKTIQRRAELVEAGKPLPKPGRQPSEKKVISPEEQRAIWREAKRRQAKAKVIE